MSRSAPNYINSKREIDADNRLMEIVLEHKSEPSLMNLRQKLLKSEAYVCAWAYELIFARIHLGQQQREEKKTTKQGKESEQGNESALALNSSGCVSFDKMMLI